MGQILVTTDIQSLRKKLQRAARAKRPPSALPLREAIRALLPEIMALRRARWSDAQIAEQLSQLGVPLSPGSLAAYVRAAQQAPASPHQSHRQKPRQNAGENEDPGVADGNTRVQSSTSQSTESTTSATVTAYPFVSGISVNSE